MLAGFSVVQVMLPPSDANAAVGFMSFGQALGGIVVLGAAGSVFQNLAAEYIAALLPGASSAEIQAVMAGTNSAFYQGLDPALKAQVVEAITKALSRTFAVNIAATAVAFVCSLFMSVSSSSFVWLLPLPGSFCGGGGVCDYIHPSIRSILLRLESVLTHPTLQRKKLWT